MRWICISKGHHSWNKGLTSECLAQARRIFEQALAIDPENVDSMIWMAAVDAGLGSSFLTDDQPQRWKEEAVKTGSASRGQTVSPGQIQPGLQHRPGPGVRCS
jgi:hypothetical protein